MMLLLVTILADAIWQQALIALIVWAVLRLSRCSNATTRHAVWMLALTFSVAVPVISALPVVWPHATIANEALPQQRSLASGVAAPTHSEAVAPSRPLSVTRPQLSVQPTLVLGLIIAWLVATVVILARLCISFFYLERLKRDALPLPVEARGALVRWERAEKGHRDVRICVSREITVPVAVGIFDAMILLPSDFVDELEPTDLDRILLHELAHVRRSDDWANLFERVVQALFFFSPGVYAISRQLDLEREVACDDWVLEKSAENMPYARCLARIVEMTQWPHDAVTAPGVFVTRKSMSIRIERLLARGRDIRVRLALVPSLVALVSLLIIVAAGGFVSPTIAYAVATAATPLPSAKQVETAEPRQGGYLDELASLGYTNLTADEVIELKRLGVDGDYIRGLQRAGLRNLTARELVEMKALGVDGNYIATLAALGYANLTAHQYVRLKALHIAAAYIQSLRSHGFNHLTVDQITRYKALGIEP